jgi:uncharacterized membrane protein (DUF373 family)
MREFKFWQITLLGFVLVTLGVVIAWLMVLKVVPSSFLLGFVVYAASTIGLILGFVGSAWYISSKRRNRDR